MMSWDLQRDLYVLYSTGTGEPRSSKFRKPNPRLESPKRKSKATARRGERAQSSESTLLDSTSPHVTLPSRGASLACCLLPAHSLPAVAFVSISNAFVCGLQVGRRLYFSPHIFLLIRVIASLAWQLYWATLILQGLQKMLAPPSCREKDASGEKAKGA